MKDGGESDHDIFYRSGPIKCGIGMVNLPVRFNLLSCTCVFFSVAVTFILK